MVSTESESDVSLGAICSNDGAKCWLSLCRVFQRSSKLYQAEQTGHPVSARLASVADHWPAVEKVVETCGGSLIFRECEGMFAGDLSAYLHAVAISCSKEGSNLRQAVLATAANHRFWILVNDIMSENDEYNRQVGRPGTIAVGTIWLKTNFTICFKSHTAATCVPSCAGVVMHTSHSGLRRSCYQRQSAQRDVLLVPGSTIVYSYAAFFACLQHPCNLGARCLSFSKASICACLMVFVLRTHICCAFRQRRQLSVLVCCSCLACNVRQTSKTKSCHMCTHLCPNQPHDTPRPPLMQGRAAYKHLEWCCGLPLARFGEICVWWWLDVMAGRLTAASR